MSLVKTQEFLVFHRSFKISSCADDPSKKLLNRSFQGPTTVKSCHGLLCLLLVMSCHVIHVFSCHVMSCHVMSCHVMSSHVMSCHVLSCIVMSCLVLSYLVMSCHVMSFSCLVKYYHVLSCIVIALPGHNHPGP
jgi:hypothetical protein